MKLTCEQMDVLISFYIEDELSQTLKSEVEKHLKQCNSCRAKYDIIKSMFVDFKNCLQDDVLTRVKEEPKFHTYTTSHQYRVFKNNLSPYLDNELTNDENIKLKKFTINNDKARKELEKSYEIRKLMNNSFRKARDAARADFSKRVLNKLNFEKELDMEMHPLVKFIIALVFSTAIIAIFVLISSASNLTSIGFSVIVSVEIFLASNLIFFLFL